MKDVHVDANFPRTADHRVYHLGLRPGEVANRIIAVGSSTRAESIALLLDDPIRTFRLKSEREFLTITGRYRGVPVSIASLGMGYPNMDFFVRETRECLIGDMVVIRLGSCGGLIGLPVGSLVIPKASVSVNRNFDYDFVGGSTADETPYRISKPVNADAELHSALATSMAANKPVAYTGIIASDVLNASADSFYSSQGRQTSFQDHNEHLLSHILESVPYVASLEMETFHLMHLASVWRPKAAELLLASQTKNTSSHGPSATSGDLELSRLPPTNLPARSVYSHAPGLTSSVQSREVLQDITERRSGQDSQTSSTEQSPSVRGSRIRAAAVQMIFASRTSDEFISPEAVKELEAWSGKAALDALAGFEIPENLLHEERGSVWEKM